MSFGDGDLHKRVEELEAEVADYKAALNKAAGNWAKADAELRELIPTDCEGERLDIADTVHMLCSDHNGDHEWEDVVLELVYQKHGGDKWVVRGARGEAWACDCVKTGHDDELYDEADEWESLPAPWDEIERRNAELRERNVELEAELTAREKYPNGFMSAADMQARIGELESLVRDAMELLDRWDRAEFEEHWHYGLYSPESNLEALQDRVNELKIEVD